MKPKEHFKKQNNMNKEKIFKSITDKMYNTFVAKNSDYGNSFEKSLDKRGLIAALMRMEDKLNRLDSLNESKSQKVKDESIEDTLLDLAVYSVLTLVYLIGKREDTVSPECNEFDLENYTPKGDLKGFPKEIIARMLDYQVEQGYLRNTRAFEKYKAVKYGGFEWSETKEGWEFWNEVINNKNFDYFFERYPKEQFFPKLQGQPKPPICPEGVKSLKEIWYTSGIAIKPGDVYFYDLSSARFDKPFMTAKVQMVTGPILRGSIICEANWDFSDTYKHVVNGKPEQPSTEVKKVSPDKAEIRIFNGYIVDPIIDD